MTRTDIGEAKRSWTLARWTAAAALLAAGLIPSAGWAQARSCSVAAVQALAPQGAVIDSAAPTAEPVPHCRIDGHIVTNDPGPNTVKFRLQLPDDGFNGRYFLIGMGGAAGHVPTNAQLPPGNPMTSGWAVAGTDTGHTGDTLDWSFIRTDRAKMIDHLHRGVHVTAVATQEITRRYYDRPKIYRYISGCSGGGRMGHMSALHHPEDFDGHLIGAPGTSQATILMFMWVSQQMAREPGAWVSPAKLEMLDRKVTAACDGLDGAVDGVVWDDDACKFDVGTVQCEAGEASDQCLTPPELRTVRAILAGPQGPKGRITAGMPISNIGTGWKTFLGATPPPWSDSTNPASIARSSSAFVMGTILSRAYIRPDYNFLTEFDFNDPADLDAWEAGVQRTGWGELASPDLRGLEKAGHKILWWHGVSDAGPTEFTTDEYFARIHQVFGDDPARVAKSIQLYKIPGMLHCGGGTGPNDAPDRLLEELVAWVEKGETPGPVVTHRGPLKPVFNPIEGTLESGVRIPAASGPPREFLLCPAPRRARFNGKPGGEMSAANWSCVRG